MFYVTHSTAFHVGVTRERFTAVSCLGSNAGYAPYQPGANRYNNPFTDEIALFQTSEGGASRMLMCKGVHGAIVETGRVFGEKGWMNELLELAGENADAIEMTLPGEYLATHPPGTVQRNLRRRATG